MQARTRKKFVSVRHCGIAGSACEHKGVITSSNLFHIREVTDSPFPPFTVEPASTCLHAAQSKTLASAQLLQGLRRASPFKQSLNMTTIGVSVTTYTLCVQCLSTDGIRMEPFGVARNTKDCLRCPQSIFVKDLKDSTYKAEFTGTKRGHYKVLTSPAISGGLVATYYAGAGGSSKYYPTGEISAFHRAGQLGDSKHDFVSACTMRKWKDGVPLNDDKCFYYFQQ